MMKKASSLERNGRVSGAIRSLGGAGGNGERYSGGYAADDDAGDDGLATGGHAGGGGSAAGREALDGGDAEDLGGALDGGSGAGDGGGGDFDATTDVLVQVGALQFGDNTGGFILEEVAAILPFQRTGENPGGSGARGLGLELEAGARGQVGEFEAGGGGDADGPVEGDDPEAVIGGEEDADGRIGGGGEHAQAACFEAETGGAEKAAFAALEQKAVMVDGSGGAGCELELDAAVEKEAQRGLAGFEPGAVEKRGIAEDFRAVEAEMAAASYRTEGGGVGLCGNGSTERKRGA